MKQPEILALRMQVLGPKRQAMEGFGLTVVAGEALCVRSDFLVASDVEVEVELMIGLGLLGAWKALLWRG